MVTGYPVVGVPLVRVDGEISAYNCHYLWAMAYPYLSDPQVSWLVLDLRDAFFSDAAPWSMLSWFGQHLRRRGGDLLLVEVSSRLNDMPQASAFKQCAAEEIMQMVLPRLLFPDERPACLDTFSACEAAFTQLSSCS